MAATRRDAPFREAMTSLLVFDGAMGSLLYERGVFVTQNFEQLNVTRPDVVRKVHEDYVAAGAQVIETNTFGANCFRLDRHGLGDQVRAYNVAGARLARQAAGEGVWVAGSVGPSGLVPATPAELALAFTTFTEQAAALVEGGADLLVLEKPADQGHEVPVRDVDAESLHQPHGPEPAREGPPAPRDGGVGGQRATGLRRADAALP